MGKSTNLNIKELLTGEVQRLRFIKRFSTCHIHHPETVAEHSYYVSLYAYAIAYWVMEQHEAAPISLADVLRRAIMHDVEEARTGDIYRPFKVANRGLSEMIEECGEEEVRYISQRIWGAGTPMSNNMLSHWRGAKHPDSFEGCIVEFADYLSVLEYIHREVMNANQSLAEQTTSMSEYRKNFDNERYSFLRILIEQSDELLEVITNAQHPK